MFRAFFIVAIFGALLSVAKSDFKCFADKMKTIENKINLFFGESREISCRDEPQKEFIDSIQHAIDQCSVPVSTDSMKSLLRELCQPGSELSNTLEQSGTCMELNRMTADITCKWNAKMDSNLPVKKACLKMKRDFFTCSANAIGGNCGEKAVRALHRIYETSDALTKGLCDEVSSSSSLKSASKYLHWIAIAVAVLTAFIVIIVKANKKNPPNRSTCEPV